jgi:protein TonB
MDRRLIIVTAVVGLHLLGLWALHTGLLRRAVALVIPVQVLAELIEPPQPVVAPAPPAPPKPTPPKSVPPQPPPPTPVARPAAPPLAGAVAEPAPQAPDAVTAPQPIGSSAPAVAEVAQTAPAALPAPPAPPRVNLPSSSADYLNNPTPPYPPLSKRMGEQGRVVIRARIEVNGSASQAEVRTSSGYERLDQAALQTVKRWRYLPGKRAGVPEAMWFNIPINFVLE